MNKKILFWVILFILGVIIIAAVYRLITKQEDIEKVTFNAVVIENNGTSLLINPAEGSSELNSSDKIVVRVPSDNAVLKDLSEFTKGSKVKIIYDGMIMESYPAQINAYSVEFIR